VTGVQTCALPILWRNVVDEHTGELVVTDDPADEETRRLVARTVAEVETEMSAMRVNTAIARLIVLNNHLTGLERTPREAVEPLLLMLADRKSTRLNSSHVKISYAVFCLKKKK